MKKNNNNSYYYSLLSFLVILTLALWLSTPHQEESGRQGESQRQLASIVTKQNFKSLQKRRTVQRLSPFELRKVQFNYRQMKYNSVQFAQANRGNERESDLWLLPKGTELLAVIDRDCTKRPSMQAKLSLDSFSRKLVDKRVNRTGLKVQSYGFLLDQDTSIDEIAAMAASDPCLVGIAENGRVQAGGIYDDPSATKQAHLNQLQVHDSEDFFFSSSVSPKTPVLLAVVDTGVDYKHVDLVDHIWSDSQGNHGYDFVNDDTDPMDDNFHGTHVAGLAAAVGGNDVGGSGIMPRGIQIMGVKILDDEGNGTYADVANGLRWAVDNGADLINLSLSGAGENAGVADALIYAANNAVPVFVSAGNNGIELNDNNNFRTPSCYGPQIDGVITIGATDAETSEKSSFSNYSPDFVEHSAPGSNGIYSTLPDNSFGALEGTSMSSPIVAGAGALIISSLKEKNFVYTAADIEEILNHSALKNEVLEDFFKNGNQLNLPRLKNYLINNYMVQSDGGIHEED